MSGYIDYLENSGRAYAMLTGYIIGKAQCDTRISKQARLDLLAYLNRMHKENPIGPNSQSWIKEMERIAAEIKAEEGV